MGLIGTRLRVDFDFIHHRAPLFGLAVSTLVRRRLSLGELNAAGPARPHDDLPRSASVALAAPPQVI